MSYKYSVEHSGQKVCVWSTYSAEGDLNRNQQFTTRSVKIPLLKLSTLRGPNAVPLRNDSEYPIRAYVKDGYHAAPLCLIDQDLSFSKRFIIVAWGGCSSPLIHRTEYYEEAEDLIKNSMITAAHIVVFDSSICWEEIPDVDALISRLLGQ